MNYYAQTPEMFAAEVRAEPRLRFSWREFVISQKPLRNKRRNVEREAVILAQYHEQRMTFGQIAQQHCISRERIRQIVERVSHGR